MEKEITLVTAYYELPKKKFTSETYINWIIKYLNLIKETNIVIYTNTEYIIELILKIRKDYLKNTKIIKKPLESLYCAKYIEYFKTDYQRDKERYHDPLLYLIWNNKTAFMYETYKKKYFESRLYIWTDIGMIRDNHTYNILKDIFPKKNLNKIRDDKVYILEVEKFLENELKEKDNETPYIFKENRCGGGVIISSVNIIEKWNKIYYDMMDKFIEKDIFVGKDQNILNNIYIKNDIIELVKPENILFDKWFYMLYYLSI